MNKLYFAYFFSLLTYLNASVGIFCIHCMLGIKILISSPKENIVIQDGLRANETFLVKCKFVSYIMFQFKED